MAVQVSAHKGGTAEPHNHSTHCYCYAATSGTHQHQLPAAHVEHINHGPRPCAAVVTALRPCREMSVREPNHHPLGENSMAMLQEALTATTQLQGWRPALAAAAPSSPWIWETPVEDVGTGTHLGMQNGLGNFISLQVPEEGAGLVLKFVLLPATVLITAVWESLLQVSFLDPLAVEGKHKQAHISFQ